MRDEDDLSPLDRLRAGIALFLAAALISFPLTFGARFGKMFRDFGSLADLPSITRFALAPWFAPLLGLVAALPAVAALGGRSAPIGARRRLVGLAYLLGALGGVLLVYAMYAPILALAGKIRAE
jgi:hypothetical protein